MKPAYYNEIKPYAARWIRNLIAAGHIPAGDVDERSIEDVRPDDLRSYGQCHFFAGIGGWPIALRLAGWPDDRPVWTGSCPCQPFSTAGKGIGFDDERHLWPAWQWLISQRRPSEILGEQVASKDVEPWIDLVSTDLEAMGYAIGTTPFPAAGIGSPNIRDRAYFLAESDYQRSQGRKRVRQRSIERAAGKSRLASSMAHHNRIGLVAPSIAQLHDTEHNSQSRSSVGVLADPDISACGQGCSIDGRRHSGSDAIARARPCGDGLSSELANTKLPPGRAEYERESGRWPEGPAHIAEPRRNGEEHIAGPINGFWRDADWLLCRDEKWRPIEPGTFPLVAGLPLGMGKLSAEQKRLAGLAGLDAASLKRAKAYRVGTLHGYGNAINLQAATEFVRVAMETIYA